MEDRLYERFQKYKETSKKRGPMVHQIGDEPVRLIMEALSDEEFRALPLISKLKFLSNQKEIVPQQIKAAFVMATCIFFSVCISALYCTVNYSIPDFFKGYTDQQIYYLKIGPFFVFFNVVANWLCTTCYSSFLEVSRDRPNADGTLWSKSDSNGSTDRRLQSSVIKDMGVRGASSYMLRYEPDESTGLQWRRCIVCQMDSPPRCHHCPLCQRCVLKRDHHCYMTGVCIGYHNQRYFTILCFYITIGSVVASYGYYCYLRNNIWYTASHTSWDFFLPVALYHGLWIGNLPLNVMSMICQMYVFAFIAPMTIVFSLFHWGSILTGKTVHEIRKSEDIVVRLSLTDRIADVFGRLFFLNFIFPAQLLFRQEGDGIHWPGVFDRGTLRKMRAERGAADGDAPPCVVKVAHVA